VYNGKKLAGILTEMSLKTDEIQYIVVGVGLNCNEEHFSKDLEKKAISLKNILGEDVDISGLLNLILEEFIENYENYSIEGLSLIIDDLRKYSAVIGKTAEITKGQLKKSCTIIGISDKAELIVKYSNGFVDKVISSQIVVDGFYGVSIK
jgi:BirA family biotin operon repressor/biotin-[acetyl-CoA-carboxylase] ligase